MPNLILKSKTYGEKECTFDDSDWNIISHYKWCIVPNRQTFYAMSRIKKDDGSYKTIRMHQLLINSKIIDHRDGNGLNNTRDNLRAATTQQNNFNVGLTKRNKSGYKGVYSYRGKYVACIRISGKLIHGGVFKTAHEAAGRYNDLARAHHQEFAWLNPL